MNGTCGGHLVWKSCQRSGLELSRNSDFGFVVCLLPACVDYKVRASYEVTIQCIVDIVVWGCSDGFW